MVRRREGEKGGRRKRGRREGGRRKKGRGEEGREEEELGGGVRTTFILPCDDHQYQ